MIKMDIEGAEIGGFAAFEQFLTIHYPSKIYNFVVELTPKWWSKYGGNMSHGLDVIEAFVDKYGYDVAVVHWGHRSRRLFGEGSPHNLAADTDWDRDQLRHIQNIPRRLLREYISVLRGQTDFWFHLREDHGGQNLAGSGLDQLENVYCDSNGWGYKEDPTCWRYTKGEQGASYPILHT